MDASTKDGRSFLPLTPAVFHVLLALSSGKAHGYGISKEIAERTDGLIKLGPGTLYGTLTRLVEAGLVRDTSARSKNDDARRRFYELTPLGRTVAKAESQRLASLVSVAREKSLLPRRS